MARERERERERPEKHVVTIVETNWILGLDLTLDSLIFFMGYTEPNNSGKPTRLVVLTCFIHQKENAPESA